MTRNTIILGILGLLILGAAGYLLFGKGSTTDGVSATAGPTSAVEQTFINLTAQLSPVSFNTSILTDARFNALQDLKTAVIPETTGRTDPFAPLGAKPKTK